MAIGHVAELAPARLHARRCGGRAQWHAPLRPAPQRRLPVATRGRTIVEVATWMGHSGQMALSTYLHVMSDLGDERVSAEEAIRRARANSDVPISYLSDAAEGKQ